MATMAVGIKAAANAAKEDGPLDFIGYWLAGINHRYRSAVNTEPSSLSVPLPFAVRTDCRSIMHVPSNREDSQVERISTVASPG